jgi:putative endonuclease
LFSYLLSKGITLKRPTTANPKLLGEWSENLACKWLAARGLKLVARNYRCQYGEIDLIMKDQGFLVFIEVRYRKNTRYGSAEASITAKKCQRLITTANNYLLAKNYGQDTALRFDAIVISPTKESDLHCTINWIKNILT